MLSVDRVSLDMFIICLSLIIKCYSWLLVWNIWIIFPYIGNSDPN